MAVAAKAKGENRRVVAIIGDGAMTAGMAFEALNNAGAMDANLLVILNDNEMSISEPVGALNNYLARLLASNMYGAVRRMGKNMLSAIPRRCLVCPTLGRAHQGHGAARHHGKSSASTTSGRSMATT